MEPQSWLCRACLLLLAFTTSVIQGKVRVVDNKGMKVFVLDEGAYSNLQYFLEELDLKRNQLYAAFPGSPKSALRSKCMQNPRDKGRRNRLLLCNCTLTYTLTHSYPDESTLLSASWQKSEESRFRLFKYVLSLLALTFFPAAQTDMHMPFSHPNHDL